MNNEKKTIVRSFSVKTESKTRSSWFSDDLDKKLCWLQRENWKIISVNIHPCTIWSCPDGYIDGQEATIIAEHEKFEDESDTD